MTATNNINSFKIFNASSVAASGSITSDAIWLDNLQPNGYFAIQTTLTGTGTAKIEILVTADEQNESSTTQLGFMLPTSGSSIATGLTVGSYYHTVTLPPCNGFKIKLTETGGANAIVPTCKIVVI